MNLIDSLISVNLPNKPNAGELLSGVFIESNFGHNLFDNWEYIC